MLLADVLKYFVLETTAVVETVAASAVALERAQKKQKLDAFPTTVSPMVVSPILASAGSAVN